jgi:drug/metabolite transporter (DMT)-like permease
MRGVCHALTVLTIESRHFAIELRHNETSASKFTMISLSLGLLAALCWSIHDVLARSVAERFGPFRLAFWVVVVGALLLLGPVLWRGTLLQAPAWAFGYALALGVVYAAAIGGLFKAFSIAPVSIVAPLTAGYPALVVVWGLLNGLVPQPMEWLGLMLILVGAVVVGKSGEEAGGRSEVPKGQLSLAVLAVAIAVTSFAAAIVLGQEAARGMGDMEATFVSRFPAALLLLPALISDGKKHPPLQVKVWLAIFAMATMDVTAVTAINAAGLFPHREIGAMAISTYGALSVLIAMVVLKERVSKGQWLGIAMIVAGMAALGLALK